MVNPIAGMGGRVGLKGTDGVVDKARELGAQPVAPKKAADVLNELIELYENDKNGIPVEWYTCSDNMGAAFLEKKGFEDICVVYEPSGESTTADDTKRACTTLLDHDIELIMFCGGDGTARDIVEVVDKRIPILGVPAGVKMHSGVFGINVKAAARLLKDFVAGDLSVGDAEIMDMDEDLYRQGTWKVKMYDTALCVQNPHYVQVGKTSFRTISGEDVKEELAEYVIEKMDEEPDTLFLLGSGSTVAHVGKHLGLKTTILGIDAVVNKEIVGTDLNEKEILGLLKKHQQARIVLSPIGAQGFILGRGNQQLSPAVIRKIGIDNIIVMATPQKIRATPRIRVDTGDEKLDHVFAEKGYMMVVIGYRVKRVVKIQTNNF